MSVNSDTLLLQKWAGVTQDSIYGAETARALVLKLGLDVSAPEPEKRFVDPSVRVDDRSEQNIATLIPQAQDRFRELVRAAALEGITIKIISGTRTYAEQDALYAKGRTAPGPKVTNAKGGFSNHNFGIAADIGVFKNGIYQPESPLYKQVGQIGKNLGFKWGGDWTSFKDEPHFEWNPMSYTVAQLRERKANGQPLV